MKMKSLKNKSGRIPVARLATNSCVGIWVAVSLIVNSWWMVLIAPIGHYFIGKSMAAWVNKAINDMMD